MDIIDWFATGLDNFLNFVAEGPAKFLDFLAGSAKSMDR